jgi:hypothetical protein
MFHSNTEQLIDYWRNRCGRAELPARSAIDPRDIADILPQIFMLGRTGPGRYKVRLAGGFIADLYGRELRQEDFLQLWEDQARTPLQLALEAVRRHPEPIVAVAEARTAVRSMRLEVLIAPLTGPSGQIDRLMGLFQPTTPLAALMGATIKRLHICGVTRTAGPDNFPRLRLAAVDGRQLA